MNGFDKLLEHFGTGLEKKLDNVLEEGFGDDIKRKAKRFKQQAGKALWWDGHVSPEEMKQKVQQASDEDLAKWVAHTEKAGPNSQNEFQHKLMKRELKRRYGVSPQGNMQGMEEGDEVGAGGRQATMKDRPSSYLSGNKLVGGS